MHECVCRCFSFHPRVQIVPYRFVASNACDVISNRCHFTVIHFLHSLSLFTAIPIRFDSSKNAIILFATDPLNAVTLFRSFRAIFSQLSVFLFVFLSIYLSVSLSLSLYLSLIFLWYFLAFVVLFHSDTFHCAMLFISAHSCMPIHFI